MSHDNHEKENEEGWNISFALKIQLFLHSSPSQVTAGFRKIRRNLFIFADFNPSRLSDGQRIVCVRVRFWRFSN